MAGFAVFPPHLRLGSFLAEHIITDGWCKGDERIDRGDGENSEIRNMLFATSRSAPRRSARRFVASFCAATSRPVPKLATQRRRSSPARPRPPRRRGRPRAARAPAWRVSRRHPAPWRGAYRSSYNHLAPRGSARSCHIRRRAIAPPPPPPASGPGSSAGVRAARRTWRSRRDT